MASYDIENNTKATREATLVERVAQLEHDRNEQREEIVLLRDRLVRLEQLVGIEPTPSPVRIAR